jgi:glutathione S-transferase
MIVLNVEPHWVSPYVFSCFVALTEKELDFDIHVLDTDKGETRTPEYLTRTITGRVPSLIHDGYGVAESTAIVDYLDDAFPERRVLPTDVKARARCRQLMSWLRSDETAAIRAERSTHSMFYERSTAPLSADGLLAAKKLGEVATRLIDPGHPHLFGDWCIADADLAFILHRLILNGDAVPANVKGWAVAAWKRPSIRAFVERERPKR